MNTYTVALTIAFSWISLTSETMVTLMVSPGDRATLHCDVEIEVGQDLRWVKMCSSQIQAPLIISAIKSILQFVPRFSLLWNATSKSYDLVIENITEADFGLYYCSRVENVRIEQNYILFEKDLYHVGEVLTRLTSAAQSDPEIPHPSETPCNPLSDKVWLSLSVTGSISALLSGVLGFLCGSICCKKKVTRNVKDIQKQFEIQTNTSPEQESHAEIYYASLNIPKRENRKKSDKQLRKQNDFSVYDGIKTTSRK